jgi:hypothetical protein
MNDELVINKWIRLAILVILFISYSIFFIPVPVLAQSVDIVWQADTYTPLFYKGKALWSNQSIIAITAIVSNTNSPQNYYYKWIRNNVVLGSLSGIGRDTVYLHDSILGKQQKYKIQIFNDNGGLIDENEIFIQPTRPSIVVYEDNPLYGIMFHREVGSSYTLGGREVTFVTFPLFYSIANRFSNVKYEWRSGAGAVETMNSVTYRTPAGASGSSPVSIKASHADEILQVAKKDFMIKFGQ